MPEYKEMTETVDVPKNTGAEGFLLVVSKLLRLPRVQNISISGSGTVRYTRVIRQDEKVTPIDIDFSSVTPFGVIRNNDIVEIEEDKDSVHAVARLFQSAAMEHLFPVVWVSGPDTTFWMWHERQKLQMSSSRDEAYGLPFLYDDQVPASTLLFATAYTRGASVLNIKKTFKILMPEKLDLMRSTHA